METRQGEAIIFAFIRINMHCYLRQITSHYGEYRCILLLQYLPTVSYFKLSHFYNSNILQLQLFIFEGFLK